ncbi:GtrA family protein [Sediminibacterium sp.]|uniref:GtrA family protein n=1 Tax=Sediminibacterium sp. TaxID=1917865 RepID=UPI0027345AF1|nr:GtrA family protein [Sediminibacterium sp.]MDP3393729.1 GtrA family protein [Sediminibacterium sp.]MDP3566497.1 GtrA family protein [Sediminibacterium sp.]
MQKLHKYISHFILSVVDWFYPMFQKLMPKQTYRYAACGGFNTVLDIGLFFIAYNYILVKSTVQLGNIVISGHIASFMMSFIVTFPTGFYLSRYVVFQETSVTKREQLGKYFLVVFGCILLNYIFLKIFVDSFGWYPTPSKILTTVFVVMFSYFSQKNFTFKAKSLK